MVEKYPFAKSLQMMLKLLGKQRDGEISKLSRVSVEIEGFSALISESHSCINDHQMLGVFKFRILIPFRIVFNVTVGGETPAQ